MGFRSDWLRIIRRAWSVRLMLLAALLSGIEVALPFFAEAMPRGWFAVLSFLAVAGAFVTRLLAQKDME